MGSSNSEMQGGSDERKGMPSFPKIWVGYLLGLATSIAEIVALTMHPELLSEQFPIPPLYLFLANFICLVYWMVCAYEFHLILEFATNGEYPIKPVRAAWFHLIPIYGQYWVYKWPRELARFVNSRFSVPVMKPERTGFMVFLAFIFFLFLARGLGMILLFWAASYLSTGLRVALAQPETPPA
jgi:hypothetical protein